MSLTRADKKEISELIFSVVGKAVNLNFVAAIRPIPTPPDENLTVNEAAKLLRISPKTVYKFSRLGRIPKKKVGGKVVFSRNELEKIFASKPLKIA